MTGGGKAVIYLLMLFVLYGCAHVDQQAIDNLANEICEAFKNYDDTNPRSIIETTKALEEIDKHYSEYEGITESQLEKTLKDICPSGYEKYLQIIRD